MIEVLQRQTFRPADHPDGPERGDCVVASVASVFGVPYEECVETKGYTANVAEWVTARYGGIVEARTQMLGDGWKRVERAGDHEQWPTSHYEPGYWLAGIWSTRIPDVERFGCGCAERVPGGDTNCRWCEGCPDERFMGVDWGLHVVVMQNARVAWDPHPDANPDAPLYFRSATTFRLVDPHGFEQLCNA